MQASFTIILSLLPAFCALLSFFLILGSAMAHPPEEMLGQYMQFRGMLRDRRSQLPAYERCRKWMVRMGASYHYGKRTDPARLLTASLLLGGLSFLVFLRISKGSAVIAGLSFLLLPWGLLPVLNRQDNRRMLPELRLIYHSLATQLRAGLYITDALAECYPSVTQPRLRDALLSLAGDLVMKSDIYKALDHFQEAFDNRQIDALCITVVQALESGQAVELLQDIAEQIRDMESSVLAEKKANLDRSLTFCQLAMLGAVLMVAVYACVSYMLGAASLI